MATFLASNNAVRFDLFNVAGLLVGMPIISNSAQFSIGPDPVNNFTIFGGTGFTYSGALFNGGTINSIEIYTAGQPDFLFSGLSMPVAQFRAFATAGNSQGFLAAVFAGDDTLTGSVFSDYLRSFAGNDLIENELGDAGNDTLDGGAGNDTLTGADGADSLLGAVGNDSLNGDNGNDTLDGGADNDTLVGAIGEDSLLGGLGNDSLDGFIGNDTLDGGAGNDSLTAHNGEDSLLGAAGNDLLSGDAGNDTIDGGADNDTLAGAVGADFLLGALGNDSLNGGGDGDTLDGGGGVDTMDGGDGNDLYFIDNAKDSIAADSSGIDSVRSTVTYVLGADLEHLFLTGAGALNGTGNAAANQIIGTGGANKLLGLDANDQLTGGDGNDTLDGGIGMDTMLGGAGNDTYFVEFSADKVIESTADKTGGIDTVFSSATDFALGDNIENLTLTSTAPTGALAIGNALNNLMIGNAGLNDLRGSGGNDTLNGNGGIDFLIGGDGTDVLNGGDGDDLIEGGNGADIMNGGAGSDEYQFVDDGDKIVEALAGLAGGAADFVVYSGSKGYTLGANIEHLSVSFSAGNVFAIGNALANTITGNGKDNLLDGRSGADDMVGLAGDDVYVVDNVLDIVDEGSGGGSGTDTIKSSVNFSLIANGSTLLGDVEHLTLLGKASTGTGNDLGNRITGNAAANLLSGLAGADTLDGGAGNDTMLGGDGDDVYVVDSKLDVIQETGGGDIADQITSSKVSIDISALGAIENIVLTGTAALNAVGHIGANNITGNDGANRLSGGGGSDTLTGGKGNDTLDGGFFTDTMAGGAGDDTYIVDTATMTLSDVIDESTGSGIDTVVTMTLFSLSTNVLGDVENLILSADAGDINGSGNALNNILTGNKGANLLAGLNGSDTIDGGAGDDTLRGGGGTDVINVGSGNDLVQIQDDLEVGDLILKFDGNAAGGQDKISLIDLFDHLSILPSDRPSHLLIVDYGATVELLVDADKDAANGYELTVATLQTTDAVTIGEDVLVTL